VVLDDEFARFTNMKLIGPLRGGTLLGFVVLGEEPGGDNYDQDDEDLLHAVSHHAGVLLAHARLAAQHRAASEARALHELSVFCMHDLKNLAGRLSLVAQNAKRFGDNPEFQRSALRTVSTTVERMMTLIQKLSAGAEFPSCSEARESTDLFEVLDSATETLKEGVRLTLPPVPTPRPKVAMAKEALRNVVLNVVTNAEQALGTEGEITILVEQADERWLITVGDDGPGIEPEVLAKVFEPFNSSKKHGLGIGLYQCRRTLQSVGGSIAVDSQPGVGTQVRLDLPLASEEVA
jgi:putative PEP-CTERM system histidine kinase